MQLTLAFHISFIKRNSIQIKNYQHLSKESSKNNYVPNSVYGPQNMHTSPIHHG